MDCCQLYPILQYPLIVVYKFLEGDPRLNIIFFAGGFKCLVHNKIQPLRAVDFVGSEFLDGEAERSVALAQHAGHHFGVVDFGETV